MYRLFPSSRAIGENLTDVIGAPHHHISGYNNRYVVNLRRPSGSPTCIRYTMATPAESTRRMQEPTERQLPSAVQLPFGADDLLSLRVSLAFQDTSTFHLLFLLLLFKPDCRLLYKLQFHNFLFPLLYPDLIFSSSNFPCNTNPLLLVIVVVVGPTL